MKRLERIALALAALAVGGGLGAILLPGFHPLNIIVFFLACGVLGKVFYQIDKRISQK